MMNPSVEKGAITKEAVSLMRRAAEITGNEEIKFAAAHIQSEYDKQHPRQQISGATKKPSEGQQRVDNPLKKQLPRSVSAPDARFQPRPPPTYQANQFVRREQRSEQRIDQKVDQSRAQQALTLQSQLPKRRWDAESSGGQFYRPPHARPQRAHPLQSSASQNSTGLILTKDDAARLQSMADRSRDQELKDLSRKVQHLFISGVLSESQLHSHRDNLTPLPAAEMAKPAEIVTTTVNTTTSVEPANPEFIDAQGSKTEIIQPLVKIDSQADLPTIVNPLAAGVSSN